MKKYKKISLSALALMVLVIANGCSDLLVEKPQSIVVPSFLTTPGGLLGALSGVYDDLRNSWGTEGFTVNEMAGTDEHLSGGSAGNPRVFTYNGIQTTDFNGAFNLYTDINTLNGVLEIGPNTAGLAKKDLNIYLGQAWFLRAFIYFYLVRTFGDVPLHATFITEATTS